MSLRGKRATRATGLIVAISALAMWIWMSMPVGTMRAANRGANPSGRAPATITVMNTNDSGAESLRQAISDAQSGDTIDFNLPGCPCTITLTTGELLIDKDLTITGPGALSLTISGNNASRVFVVGTGVLVAISNLTMSNGSSSGLGGSIFNTGTLTITNSTLSGNSVSGISGLGGGIYNNNGSTLTITNSTLSDNSVSGSTSGLGGGIYNSGTLTITNSTLSDNSATTSGGGIYNNGTLTITNSTIANNSASGSGGGIFNNTGVSIKNSIVANSPSGGDCAGSGTFNASGGANFATDSSCPGFNEVPSTGPGGLNLGVLQVNAPGTTATHALLAGSVAVDAATDCTDFDDNPVLTDQRGSPRFIDGDGDFAPLCDAGAYEAPPCTNGTDSFPPLITCPPNISIRTSKPGAASVIATYPPPAAEDNCSIQSVVCTPPSGSTFPAGMTTVTCTATDPSGNTATCSFTISTFDVCLQDDTNPTAVLLWNSQTGDYVFCCGGFIFMGRGVAARQGNLFTLAHNTGDRRLSSKADAALNKGTASLQSPVGVNRCSITDRDTRNNSCACP